MEPTRVVLADDHGLIRAGIRELLERLDGVEVIAEASDVERLYVSSPPVSLTCSSWILACRD
jgi:DNA-binding NarL/FixJ family response regulator